MIDMPNWNAEPLLSQRFHSLDQKERFPLVTSNAVMTVKRQ